MKSAVGPNRTVVGRVQVVDLGVVAKPGLPTLFAKGVSRRGRVRRADTPIAHGHLYWGPRGNPYSTGNHVSTSSGAPADSCARPTAAASAAAAHDDNIDPANAGRRIPCADADGRECDLVVAGTTGRGSATGDRRGGRCQRLWDSGSNEDTCHKGQTTHPPDGHPPAPRCAAHRDVASMGDAARGSMWGALSGQVGTPVGAVNRRSCDFAAWRLPGRPPSLALPLCHIAREPSRLESACSRGRRTRLARVGQPNPLAPMPSIGP